MRIDAHQHFWHYDEGMEWITEEMSAIRKDFLPGDLSPLLEQEAMEGCIAIQADQSAGETDFLLQCAEKNNFVKGVVGWIDLQAADIKEQLSAYRANTKLKGFRHVLQSEAPEFMLYPGFVNGIAALHDFAFTYDLLIFPQHLPAALELVKKFPQQAFVVDHIAKPNIREGLAVEWKKGIKAIAEHENVYCKISGMVTEADWQKWKQDDFIPYLDVVTEAFGTNRLMYGSDWPVCLVAASYAEIAAIVKKYFCSFSADEQAAVFGGNVSRFYHLS